MDNNTFTYRYSAAKNKEIESIRRKYLPPKEDKLKTLRRLDLKVENAGMLESLCLGIGGVLIFGVGICFMVGALSGGAWLAALFTIAGALLMIHAYPIYKRIFQKRRRELAPEILRLTEEIIKLQKNQ